MYSYQMLKQRAKPQNALWIRRNDMEFTTELQIKCPECVIMLTRIGIDVAERSAEHGEAVERNHSVRRVQKSVLQGGGFASQMGSTAQLSLVTQDHLRIKVRIGLLLSITIIT